MEKEKEQEENGEGAGGKWRRSRRKMEKEQEENLLEKKMSLVDTSTDEIVKIELEFWTQNTQNYQVT